MRVDDRTELTKNQLEEIVFRLIKERIASALNTRYVNDFKVNDIDILKCTNELSGAIELEIATTLLLSNVYIVIKVKCTMFGNGNFDLEKEFLDQLEDYFDELKKVLIN